MKRRDEIALGLKELSVLPKSSLPKMKEKPLAHQKQAHYLGHRHRLRQRFFETEGKGLADYELLELFLFGACPRGDTKPLAKRLILIFGGLEQVFEASPDQLSTVEGIGDAGASLIKVAHMIGIKRLHAKMKEGPILDGWRQIVSYCQSQMGHLKKEQLRIFFLDGKNRLIADELHQEGTVNQTALYIREIVQRALDLGASALILVHNHPTGDPTPSRADILITHKLCEALKYLDINLSDHLIMGKGRHVSLKAKGFF